MPDRSPVWLEPDFGHRCEMVRGGARCRYGSALMPVRALAPLGGAVAGVGIGCLVGRASELGCAEGLSLGGGLAAEGCRATLARFGRCAAVRAPRLAAFAWLAASGGHLAGLVRLVVTCLAARLSAARARLGRHGADEALGPVADQVLASGAAQGLLHQLVVLRLAVLDESALHGLLMRVARDVDRLHRAWVNARVEHARRHG